MPLHVSAVTRPSSGGCAHRNLHAVNTQPPHAITPNSICAEPPEDGRVTLETCRGIDSLQNELREVNQVGVDSLMYMLNLHMYIRTHRMKNKEVFCRFQKVRKKEKGRRLTG
jgi:hypothetical protein